MEFDTVVLANNGTPLDEDAFDFIDQDTVIMVLKPGETWFDSTQKEMAKVSLLLPVLKRLIKYYLTPTSLI